MRRLALLLLLVVFAGSALPVLAARARAPLGSDGRLTLLLLGSDLRSYPPSSERTDTIMIVSIEPVSGSTMIASIPRDVEGLPLPGPRASVEVRMPEWNRDRYDGKINALLGDLVGTIRARDKVGYEAAVRTALPLLRRTIGYAMGVEIDGTVLASFGAMRSLAAKIGGEVTVDLPLELRFRDCSRTLAAPDGCVDYTPRAPKGATSVTVRVPAAEWLGFARSRKDDHDYARAARGQLLISGIVARLRAEGPQVALDILAEIATGRGMVRTDLDLLAAPDLWAIMGRANLASATRTVFGPPKFAYGGARLYQVLLKDTAARAWVDEHLPPAARSGAWPLPFLSLPALPPRLRPETIPPCPWRSARICLR